MNIIETKIDLDEYLEKNSRAKDKDSYSMSIRELINMYEDGLINLSPVYQRKFRWDNLKASKLIESIFLSIPLPPIFVSVRNGQWDIVDGVQRVSSILWFCGKLKEKTEENNEEKVELRSPLKLTELEILEALNNHDYSSLKANFSKEIFKYFDMKRLDVTLLTSNDVEAEYDLFNRLNTGGITLSSQEIRNFLMVKLNSKFYDELVKVSKLDTIKKVLGISKKQDSEDYGMELLTYAIIISKAYSKFKSLDNNTKVLGLDIYKKYVPKFSLSRSRFIDKCISIILNEKLDIEEEIFKLTEIFKTIFENLGESPFSKGRKFSPFLYICLISYLYNNNNKMRDLANIFTIIQENDRYIKKANRGTNVVDQFITGIEIGRDI
jgi:hypothetical protein